MVLTVTSIAPASAQIVIDREPGTEAYFSGLRVEFFSPMGQSFVPDISQLRRHRH